MKILLTAIFMLAFLCISSVIHEYSHALAAIILGASLSDIHVYLFAIPPRIEVTPYSFPEVYSPYFHLAGGLGAGMFLLVIYALILTIWSRGHGFKPFDFSSLIGFAVLLFAAIEIYQSFWEANEFEAYVKLQHWQSPWVALPIVLPFLVHFLATPIRKHFINKLRMELRHN